MRQRSDGLKDRVWLEELAKIGVLNDEIAEWKGEFARDIVVDLNCDSMEVFIMCRRHVLVFDDNVGSWFERAFGSRCHLENKRLREVKMCGGEKV